MARSAQGTTDLAPLRNRPAPAMRRLMRSKSVLSMSLKAYNDRA